MKADKPVVADYIPADYIAVAGYIPADYIAVAGYIPADYIAVAGYTTAVQDFLKFQTHFFGYYPYLILLIHISKCIKTT